MLAVIVRFKTQVVAQGRRADALAKAQGISSFYRSAVNNGDDAIANIDGVNIIRFTAVANAAFQQLFKRNAHALIRQTDGSNRCWHARHTRVKAHEAHGIARLVQAQQQVVAIRFQIQGISLLITREFNAVGVLLTPAFHHQHFPGLAVRELVDAIGVRPQATDQGVCTTPTAIQGVVAIATDQHVGKLGALQCAAWAVAQRFRFACELNLSSSNGCGPIGKVEGIY